MLNQRRVLVTGAGGFIGHHLTKYLIARDYWVRGVDVKRPEYEPTAAHEFELLDLRRWDNCLQALRDVHEVYALAAEMGGIGFIETHKAEIVRDSTMINIHSIEAARVCGVKRFLFTSSACIYPGYLQKRADVTPLKEDDAYPADAEDGYGWEKLPPHAVFLLQSHQPRPGSDDHDQRTRRHGGRSRREADRSGPRSYQTAGCAWQKQRQHTTAGGAGVGAVCVARRGSGADLPVD